MLCPCCGQDLPEDGALRIDDAGFVVFGGRVAKLTQAETEVFGMLRAARGAGVSRQSLLAALYPIEADEADIKIIDVFISKLRKKLKPLGLEISTIWGRGYRFVPPTGKDPSERTAS